MSTFGEEIKRERELRQITLREIAEATKINRRYLEALERNQFEVLPGGVFNKGFVRAYAQFIGVDPEGMVDAYLLEERAQGDLPMDGGEPGFQRGRNNGPTDRRQIATGPRAGTSIRRGLWIAAAIVLTAGLVGAIVYFAFFTTDSSQSDQPAVATTEEKG